MTSLINQNANNDASIIDQLCSVEDETRGLSNGDEPQCLMSTDAGEETDDFGDSGDATECAEDVNDPEDPKLVDPTSSLGINLQQTASAKTTAAIAASLKSRKRPSDQQHSSEKRPKTSSKNRRKNIRNVLSSKELNEDTLAALQAEQERLQRSSKPVSSDLNRLLFGDPSDIGCSSNEAACSSAPKKQKTELTDIHKTQVIKLEATDAVNEANEGPFKFDAQDVNNLNVNNAIHPNAAECEAVKPDLVFLSDDEDDICVQSKSTNNFRHDPSRDLDISDNEADDEDEGDDVICIDQSPNAADEDYDEETDAEYDDSTLDDFSLSSLTQTSSNRVLVNVAHPVGDPDVLLSAKISEKIKPHQVQGIRFLYSNIVENFSRFERSQGFGCVLGHSMGLGKTLQVVAFSELFFEYKLCNKILVIVPINTVQNWINEFGMWTDAEIFDWNKHKTQKAQRASLCNVVNSPGAERQAVDSGLLSPTNNATGPAVVAQLIERYDRIARIVCNSPPSIDNFEILSEMCNNFKEISFNTNSTQPIQSQISQLFREPTESVVGNSLKNEPFCTQPSFPVPKLTDVPKPCPKEEQVDDDGDDFQLGFDMIDFESMEDFPTQNLDVDASVDEHVETANGESEESRRACELQIKQELEQIAKRETDKCQNDFTVPSMPQTPIESTAVLNTSLIGNHSVLGASSYIEPMEIRQQNCSVFDEQENVKKESGAPKSFVFTDNSETGNDIIDDNDSASKTGDITNFDTDKHVPMDVSVSLNEDSTKTETTPTDYRNENKENSEIVEDEEKAENVESPKKASLFTVYRIPDDCKLNKDRMEIVDIWYNSGGVLLMGYEMFRLLSKLKSTSLTSAKSVKGNNIAELRRKQEENALLIEKLHNQLLNPGGPDIIIADEGHRIKNNDSAIAKCLKALRTKRRVVLTGYPLQNNLVEYWCMVDFVRPNYLGSKQEFSNMFERPITNGQCADSTAKDIKLMKYRSHVLTSLLKGFVLRRSHSVLIKALPKKTEFIICVRMSPIQKELYRSYLSHIAAPSANNSNSPTFVVEPSSLANPIRAFASLCKIWNHPDVLYQSIKQQQMQAAGRSGNENGQGDELLGFEQSFSSGSIDYSWAQSLMSHYRPGNINDGPKLLILLEIIRMSIQKKEKVLVFSQSLGTLTLIEECLAKCTVPNTAQIWKKNVHYFRLDGETSPTERGEMISKFNKESSSSLESGESEVSSTTADQNGGTPWLFLLSTKAGCLGINLIGASRVVIMDVCWNPCHDAQAVCRVFRYGQTKPTFVYRLVANNTMEKRMYDRQVSKQGMSQRIVDELNPQIFLTKNEVETLLDYREETDIVDHTVSLNRYNDELLQDICSLYYPMIAKSPFEHESLLVSNETKLSIAEKREAREGYQRDRQRELLGASGVPMNSFFEKTHLNTMASMLLARSGNRSNRRFRDDSGPPSETLLSLLIKNRSMGEGTSNSRNMPIPGEIVNHRGPKPIANIRPFSVRQPPHFNTTSNSNNYVQSTFVNPWPNAIPRNPIPEGMNNEIEFILASDVRIPGERTYSGHDMILSTGERVTLSSSGNSFYLKAANGSVFQMNASTAGSLLNACSSSCNTNNSFGNLQNNCNNINSTPNGVATTSQLFGVGGSASSPSINYRNHTPHVQNLQQSNNPSNMQPPFSAINTVQPHGQSLPQWSNSNCPPQSILNTRQNRRIEPSPSVAKDNSTSTFRHQSGPGMPTNDAPTSSEVIELSDSSEETE